MNTNPFTLGFYGFRQPALSIEVKETVRAEFVEALRNASTSSA
ncbi:hypothetical protein [Ottowia thiooxydans]|uniref:Uncharacterized protein n=1 Tax=Ottowia thiooxydans TaxID=219182 RepID=A0ABV2QA89_9BURK